MEPLTRELGIVIDQLWPSYERAALHAGIPLHTLGSELVLGGWSPKAARVIATAYAKHSSEVPAVVQTLEGGMASPGEPLQGREDSFIPEAVLQSSRIQAAWLNKAAGREVAGGRVLAAVLRKGQMVIHDLGAL